MVCRIDLIDDVETIENFKRMQRDQWAEYRGQFRYLYIWDRQAAFSCNGEFLHFLQHIQSKRVHTKERRTPFSLAGNQLLIVVVTPIGRGASARPRRKRLI